MEHVMNSTELDTLCVHPENLAPRNQAYDWHVQALERALRRSNGASRAAPSRSVAVHEARIEPDTELEQIALFVQHHARLHRSPSAAAPEDL
jgi:hypothetical protein